MHVPCFIPTAAVFFGGTVLDDILTQRNYFHGDGTTFGVEDVMMAATLLYYAVMKPTAEEVGMSGYPALVAYMQRIGSRPALVSRYPKEHWEGKVVAPASA